MFNSQKPNIEDLPTKKQLLISTVIALIVSIVILIIVVLPSEYGVDITGIGSVIGLKKMGEIKTSLDKEAKEDKKHLKKEVSKKVVEDTNNEHGHSHNSDSDHNHGDNHSVSELSKKTEQVKTKLNNKNLDFNLSACGDDHGNGDHSGHNHGDKLSEKPAEKSVHKHGYNTKLLKKTKLKYEIQPGKSIEVKLAMDKGSKITYKWSCLNGKLSYDLHGDSKNKDFTSYKKGRPVPEEKGIFFAKFTGNHGWYWKNKGDKAVSLTLEIFGNFKEVKEFL